MVLLILVALTSGVAILFGLVVMGLLEAPWPILLTLLVLGLYGLQRLTARAIEWGGDEKIVSAELSAPAEQTVPPEASIVDNQTFIYRGVKYQAPSLSAPVVDESPTVVEGIYRGQRWRRSSTEAKPPKSAAKKSTELIYRGHRVKS